MGSPPTLIIFAILRSENMKIAIYTRVSTLEQKEKGYSIDEQERKLRSYCEIND